MSKRITCFFIILIFHLLVFAGCGNLKREVKPEDKIVKLDKTAEPPIGKDRNYEVGDDVAVVLQDGRFFVDGYVKETSDEKSAAKNFRVQIGTGRSAIDEWFSAEQMFPAPWANNKNLEIGDTVYRKRFGDFEPDKGVITDLPKSESGGFKVKFDDKRTAERIDAKEIFSTIEQAEPEDLSPGKIVYYDKKHWAIVIGKRDNKIIVRQTGTSPEDILIDVSKLEILE